jgi:hypothetical protein
VVGGSFSLTAPIYTGSSEANSSIVDLGRGYSRGAAVTGGWGYGGGQGTLSWGSNTVDSVIPTDTKLNTGGGALGGDFLQYDFNAGSSNPNECMISPFDSVGGVFIEVNGTYELAGVNSFYAVRIPTGGTDDAYNVTDASGNPIAATLDDTQGYDYLLGFNAQDQPVVKPITTATPESSFATRVSSKQNFIGLVDGTIPASQAASHPINDDGLLTLYSNLTTGAITGGAQIALGGNGADTRLTLASNSGVTQISSLSIPFGSVLDITNNKVILSYTSGHDPIASVIAWIKDGYAGGSWTGDTGITSSAPMVVNGFSYGIGYADGADGEVAGLPSGEIEIMYTLLGDANLDGTVNAEDFTPFSQNLNKPGNWDQGDFNYDGTVNSEDFTPFSHNFGQSVVQSGDLEAASDIGLTNIPEPASLGLMVVAGFTALRRRRPQRSSLKS